MRHQRLRRKLGVKSQHRQALLRNLIRSLVIHKRIRTTVAKAREASAYADRLVTIAKRGDLHARRLLISKLGAPDTAKTLISQIAPHFKDRNGGYTRVLRLGSRPGDASEMALLEFSALIVEPKTDKPKKGKKKKEAKVKEDLETPKKEKTKEKKDEEASRDVKEAESAEEQPKKQDKKESEKKGGFLSTLRKFLKGDE